MIGPNADNMYNQLGDYTSPQEPERIVTMLEGICEKGRAEVVYAKGCSVRNEADADIESAVKAAQSADAVVLVVGGSSARDSIRVLRKPHHHFPIWNVAKATTAALWIC